MKLVKVGPWVVGLLAVAWVASSLLPARPVRGMDLDAFGRLPVLEGGRIKPVDSVARNSLLMIRSQMSFRFEEEAGGQKKARTVGADEWLLDVLFRPEVADAQPAFVINDPDVLSLIGQKLSQTNRYFAFRDIRPFLGEIESQASAAEPIDSKQRTRFQGAVVNLYQRIDLYLRLQNTVQVPGGKPLAVGAGRRQRALGAGAALAPRQRLLLPAAPAAGRRQGQLAQRRRGPGRGGARRGHRRRAGLAGPCRRGLRRRRRGRLQPGRGRAAGLRRGRQARGGGPGRPRDRLQPRRSLLLGHGHLRGGAAPGLRLLALAARAAAALGPARCSWPARWSTPRGLISRVILQGRPPVTNLYSSAVFVGWGAVVLGIVLERMYRKGFGTAVAAAGRLRLAHRGRTT